MELVENHRADAGERWIALHLPHKEAVGHKANACSRRQFAVVTGFKSHDSATFVAEFVCDPHRKRASGKPSRLKYNDVALHAFEIEQHLRKLRALSRAGRRHHDESVRIAHCVANLITSALYRQLLGRSCHQIALSCHESPPRLR